MALPLPEASKRLSTVLSQINFEQPEVTTQSDPLDLVGTTTTIQIPDAMKSSTCPSTLTYTGARSALPEIAENRAAERALLELRKLFSKNKKISECLEKYAFPTGQEDWKYAYEKLRELFERLDEHTRTIHQQNYHQFVQQSILTFNYEKMLYHYFPSLLTQFQNFQNEKNALLQRVIHLETIYNNHETNIFDLQKRVEKTEVLRYTALPDWTMNSEDSMLNWSDINAPSCSIPTLGNLGFTDMPGTSDIEGTSKSIIEMIE